LQEEESEGEGGEIGGKKNSQVITILHQLISFAIRLLHFEREKILLRKEKKKDKETRKER
jgi:hypothetical protein